MDWPNVELEVAFGTEHVVRFNLLPTEETRQIRMIRCVWVYTKRYNGLVEFECVFSSDKWHNKRKSTSRFLEAEIVYFSHNTDGGGGR